MIAMILFSLRSFQKWSLGGCPPGDEHLSGTGGHFFKFSCTVKFFGKHMILGNYWFLFVIVVIVGSRYFPDDVERFPSSWTSGVTPLVLGLFTMLVTRSSA